MCSGFRRADWLTTLIARLSLDWIKYGSDVWILYTRETPESLYQHILRTVPELKTRAIFSFYFDNRGAKSGQMVKCAWEWLNKQR
jgi:hypothetical protein